MWSCLCNFGDSSCTLIVGKINFWETIVLMLRVGQNRIYTPYMTVYLGISLPKMPYTHRIYMVLANPMYAVYTIAPNMQVFRVLT